MSPRITLFDPGTMSEAQREVYEAIINGPRGRLVGPLRAVLLVPELAMLWSRFGEHLRFSTSIPQRNKELAILVTARRWNSQVEWEIHASDALAAGVPPAIIDAIRVGELPALDDEADAEVYEFARQLLETGDVDDGVHAAITARWSEAGAVELTAVIGYYSMVSLMLNAQGIPTLNGTQPLQPLCQASGLSTLPAAMISRGDRARSKAKG